MKKLLYFLFSVLAACIFCSCEENMHSLTMRVYALAEQQCLNMEAQLSDNSMPRTYTPQGIFIPSELSWWCSGFYPGTLWLVFENTNNEQIKQYAVKNCHKLDNVPACMSDHDLGFQYWCSDGRAWKATADTIWLPRIEEAAELLAQRFNPAVGCIRSWGDDSEDYFRVIIDNMMNLELLMEASKLFDRKEFADIAITHAKTTMKNHFRDDYSCYHLVKYDSVNGNVISRETVQGFSDSSSWARGQAWALYGYTMMYRETQIEEFLVHAQKVADYIISRMPQDMIPYWDFDCPAIPYTYKDASAAAIMASAFVELSTFCPDEKTAKKYLDTAEKQLRKLSSPDYIAEVPGSNGCFILRHSVGNLHGDESKRILEIDAPLTYADYYFLEALSRYERLSIKKSAFLK